MNISPILLMCNIEICNVRKIRLVLDAKLHLHTLLVPEVRKISNIRSCVKVVYLGVYFFGEMTHSARLFVYILQHVYCIYSRGVKYRFGIEILIDNNYK